MGTIAIIGRLKVKRVPDVLVICLAIADLVSTLVPIPMAIYAYFVGRSFTEGSHECNTFGLLAQWSRYTAAFVVTLISVDRYLAIAFPVFYQQRVKLWHMVVAIICCACLSTTLAFIPLSPEIRIISGDAICLFSFVEYGYASVIVLYAGVQFVIVLFCFVSTIYHLIRIWWRRRKMTRQSKRNVFSDATFSSGPTFSKPGLQNRFNELNQAFKRVAPKISESLSLSIEAQFARMLLCITVLFYLTWLPTVLLIVYALAIGKEDGCAQREALFWAIRFTVISTGINPFLYGLLCRQYRQLYIYLFRLIFHRCCDCLHEPYYSPFKHRDQPPKAAEEKMRRAKQKPREYVRYYGSYRSFQSFYSQMSNSSSTKQTALTRSTTRTNISLPHLAGIVEEEYLTMINETSTHMDSAGAIESTVVIPESARDESKAVPLPRSLSYSEDVGLDETYFNDNNTSRMANGDIYRRNPGYSDSEDKPADADRHGKIPKSTSAAFSEGDDDIDADISNLVWISPDELKGDKRMSRNSNKDELEGREVVNVSGAESSIYESEEEGQVSSESGVSESDEEKELHEEEESDVEIVIESEGDGSSDLDTDAPLPQTLVKGNKPLNPPVRNVYNFDQQFEEFEKMIQDAAFDLS